MTERLVDRVEMYRDKSAEWRWRAMAGNNRIVANGGEGYQNKRDCLAVVGVLFAGVPVEVVEE